MKHRVVAAVLHRGDNVLLCHRRSDRQWYPNVWDLPGGHIEGEESPAKALERELLEELSITIAAPEDDPAFSLTDEETSIMVWKVERWTGQPTNAALDEHDMIGWFTAGELRDLDMADPRIAQICLDVLGKHRP